MKGLIETTCVIILVATFVALWVAFINPGNQLNTERMHGRNTNREDSLPK